jgi:hypothetical protein
VWSAREIGCNGEYGREMMVNRNFATPVGGGPMRPVNLFHRVPINRATGGGISGIADEWRQMPMVTKVVIGVAGALFAYLAFAKAPKE